MMTAEEMRRVIEETVAARYEADRFRTATPPETTLHPPATPADIAQLETHLRSRGIRLPRSFAQFLQLHDGIDEYLPSMGLSMRSARQIVEAQDRDANWKGIFTGYQFTFASGADSSARVGFVPETADGRGEMQVVMRGETGETTEYDDFEEFLEDQLSYFQDVVSARRADREGLSDD